MAESFCRVGDIEICFETFGDPADPAVLLVMGLGTQMLGWHEDFCADLAGRGFHVIRYDNRDIGRSTILSSAPSRPSARSCAATSAPPPYTLADMAADGVGLLDHLGIERAHIVGVSMGGMIAQTIAARRPERVLSLTSIMSSTGSRWRGQPALRTYRQFLRPVSTDRATYIAETAALFDIIGSPGFERDDDDLRDAPRRACTTAATTPARSPASSPPSSPRATAPPSCAASPRPTLVIHGTADRLVAPSGGRATARAIPGARLLHDRGHGPRPPPRRLAPDHRRDRRERAARRSPRGRPPGRVGSSRSGLGTRRHLTEGGVAMKRVLGTVVALAASRRARRRRQRVGQAVVTRQAPRARQVTTGRPSPSSSTPPATPRPTRVPPATASATS